MLTTPPQPRLTGGSERWPSRTAAYERHRTRMIAYGRWQPYVDAEPARQHVLWLRSQNMGPKRISEVSGVPHGSLAKLVYGDPQRGLAPSKRIRPETAARILATRPDPYPRANVPSIGARRRLRALVALGWTQSELARRVGLTRAAFYRMIHTGPETAMHAATVRRAREVYAELSMTPPPMGTARARYDAEVARETARRHGWKPPLALDDDRLDDPTYRTNRGAA